MREYLFEYDFDGSTWGITIFADDIEQARRKMRAAGLASYKGELALRIPVTPPWKWPLGFAASGIGAAILLRLAGL